MDVVRMTEIQTDDGDTITVISWDSEPGAARVVVEESSSGARIKRASAKLDKKGLDALVAALGGVR